MREMWVPGLERVNGGVVKRGEAVAQGPCPGAEGELHDDGAVFHPGKRNAVIKFADIANEVDTRKANAAAGTKWRIFTGENLLKARGNYLKKNF